MSILTGVRYIIEIYYKVVRVVRLTSDTRGAELEPERDNKPEYQYE